MDQKVIEEHELQENLHLFRYGFKNTSKRMEKRNRR